MNPADLKITDVRFADIDGAPKRCTLVKVYTNSDIVGYSELRDASSRTYAAMLKSRIIGENPCNVDKIFRRIKQFGGNSRQAGGVSALEVACWDIAGKAWEVPVWQLLGGRFRDRIRCYCDTPPAGNGRDMGRILKQRMSRGFTFLRMELGMELLLDIPGTLCAPTGFLKKMSEYKKAVFSATHGARDERALHGEAYDIFNIEHPLTGIHFTELGLDYLENYMLEVRNEVGFEIPIAIDHIGHIPVEDSIKLARRLEKYNLSWMEDPLPWQLTEQWKYLHNSTNMPLATGEHIYLKEGFRPLLDAGALAAVHPDVLSAGGLLETKKIGDMAEEYGVQMNLHMAESPIGCLAAVHVAAATRNFVAMELHSIDTPWWASLIVPALHYEGGYINVPNTPGLGIEALNETLIKQKLHRDFPEAWAPTSEWDEEWSDDRLWS